MRDAIQATLRYVQSWDGDEIDKVHARENQGAVSVYVSSEAGSWPEVIVSPRKSSGS